jgi:AcrR family transcriptional regulator
MGIAERRAKEKEKVRTAILTTAWQMVKDEGWQSLSIRKIADSIEYSVPVIYDHFENKEAILFEFGKEGFRILEKKMKDARDKETDPAKQLKAMANAFWDFSSRNKEYYQLMYGQGMMGCEIEKCLPEKTNFRNIVNEPLKALIAKGKDRKADVCLKFYTFWSILHGLISMKNMRGTSISDEINKMVMEDAIAGFIKNLE